MHILVFLDGTMHLNFSLRSYLTISFAYHFEIQGIKRLHILLNNWQILISETRVKSLNYFDSVGFKKRDWCLTKLFYTARVSLKIFELKFQSIKKQRCAKIKNSALKFKID